MTLRNAQSANWFFKMFVNRGTQTFQNSRSHLKILGARKMAQSKDNEDPQIFENIVQNVVAWVT